MRHAGKDRTPDMKGMGTGKGKGVSPGDRGTLVAGAVKRVLDEVDDGRFANTALHRVLRGRRWSPDEKETIGELSYGVLRWRLPLESALSSGDTLRLTYAGFYIFHDVRGVWWDRMGLMPRREEKLKEALERSGLARYVNAQEPVADVPEKVVLSSAPAWMVRTLEDGYGRKAALGVLRDALLAPVELHLRANTLKTDRDSLLGKLLDSGVRARPLEPGPDAVAIPDRSIELARELYHEGLFEVQGLSAQLACRMTTAGLKGHDGGKVMDACAGAGGKTLALGALMNNKGLVLALDVNPRSLARLKQRARQAGLFNYAMFLVDDGRAKVAAVPDGPSGPAGPGSGLAGGGEGSVTDRPAGVVRGSPDSPDADGGLKRHLSRMDAVLVDAPCSGLGTLRRNPDIKLHLDPGRMAAFPALQSDLLERYAVFVRPGGLLVYSTCTLNPEENEEVVEGFAARHGEFGRTDARTLMPGLPDEFFRGPYFNPVAHPDAGGFFAAALVREG